MVVLQPGISGVAASAVSIGLVGKWPCTRLTEHSSGRRAYAKRNQAAQMEPSSILDGVLREISIIRIRLHGERKTHTNVSARSGGSSAYRTSLMTQFLIGLEVRRMTEVVFAILTMVPAAKNQTSQSYRRNVDIADIFAILVGSVHHVLKCLHDLKAVPMPDQQQTPTPHSPAAGMPGRSLDSSSLLRIIGS